MRSQPSLRVIVCDDDVVLRGALGNILGNAGFHVIGEADAFDTARELVDTNDVDVVLLDLALAAGAGEDLLDHLSVHRPGVRPVVFSAFVEDEHLLLTRGAAAVFHKPDFDGLETWLQELSEELAVQAAHEGDRRRPPQPAPVLPDTGPRSPSGLEHWLSFRAAIDGLWPGDAVLALDLLEHASIAALGDPTFLLDHRLTIGRLVAPALRPLDRIAATPSGIVVCLLVAGHPETPSAVFDRFETCWHDAGFTGTPIGAFGHVRPGNAPAAVFGSVLDKIQDPSTTADHPLRLA